MCIQLTLLKQQFWHLLNWAWRKHSVACCCGSAWLALDLGNVVKVRLERNVLQDWKSSRTEPFMINLLNTDMFICRIFQEGCKCMQKPLWAIKSYYIKKKNKWINISGGYQRLQNAYIWTVNGLHSFVLWCKSTKKQNVMNQMWQFREELVLWLWTEQYITQKLMIL